MSYHDKNLETSDLRFVPINPKRAQPKIIGNTIGDHARHALRIGFNNKDTLAYVKALFPGAGTSAKCISTYRKELRNAGENVPTSRQIDIARAVVSDLVRAQRIDELVVNKFEPHEFVRMLFDTLRKYLSPSEVAKALEALGQSAFYMSDMALESRSYR